MGFHGFLLVSMGILRDFMGFMGFCGDSMGILWGFMGLYGGVGILVSWNLVGMSASCGTRCRFTCGNHWPVKCGDHSFQGDIQFQVTPTQLQLWLAPRTPETPWSLVTPPRNIHGMLDKSQRLRGTPIYDPLSIQHDYGKDKHLQMTYCSHSKYECLTATLYRLLNWTYRTARHLIHSMNHEQTAWENQLEKYVARFSLQEIP